MSATAPDYSATVTGWRTWLVDDSGPEARLLSVVRPTGWPVADIGLVALWGSVVEGEAGWRASAAYPEALYLPVRREEEREPCDRIAWDLSAYGVPIAVVDCAGRGLVDALRDVTPLAAGPLPVPIAA